MCIRDSFNNGEVAETEAVFTYQPTNVKPDLSADWNNLLGTPEHVVTASSSVNPPLEMAWVKNIGANIYMTSPLVYNGMIYVASVDENLQGDAHIYACLLYTSVIRWL